MSAPVDPPGAGDWAVPASRAEVFHARRHRCALVIPVLDEGERIRAQLARIAALAPGVDVVVADGGSTDGALEADFLRAQGVRALLTRTGPGKLGAQLRIAYAFALREGYEGIVTIDGNGKDGAEAIPAFLARLAEGFDYVQGSRYAPGGRAENTPADRAAANRLIHAPLLSLAGRFRFTDTTNGFRAYSRRYLLDPRVAPFRDVFVKYELLFYLTVRAGQLGYRVCEIPVRRIYPAGSPAPTKIRGLGSRLDVLKQTILAAAGRFAPPQKE